MAAIPAESAAGSHHTVVRQPWNRRCSHDGTDGPRGTGPPGEDGHVAIGGDPAGRDPAHDAQHTQGEL